MAVAREQMHAKQKDIGIFVCYVAVLYATLSAVLTITQYLQGLLGTKAFGVLLTGLIIASGAWVVARISRRLTGRGPVLVVIGVVLAYGYLLFSLENPAERVHVLEYGPLAYLAYRVLRHRRRDFSILPASLLLCTLVSFGDEGIQWLLPRRWGEMRDVWVNIESSLLALVMLAATRPSESRVRPTPKSLATLGPWVAAVLLAGGLFLRCVHGFGCLIVDPQAGSFRSVFSRQELLEPAAWKADAVSEFGDAPSGTGESRGIVQMLQSKVRERNLKTPTPLAYAREAADHAEARDRLSKTAKRSSEGYSEHLILKRYFGSYYDRREGVAWTPEKERKVGELAGGEGSPTYESTIQRYLITSFSETVLWRVVIPVSVLLLLAPALTAVLPQRD